MVNILLIQDTDWITRGPHQQHHIFERLSVKGAKVHVIDYELLWKKSPRSSLFNKGRVIHPRSKTTQKATNITIHRPPILKIPLLDIVTIPIFHSIWINKVIRENKIQVIVGQTVLNSFFGLFFSRIYRIPFIFHCIDSIHSLSADYIPRALIFIAKLLEMTIARFSNLNIAINKSLRDYVIRLGGKEKKTIYVPTGVDFSRYQDETKREIIREKFGMKETDLVLFFMGWLYNFSGLKDLAEKVMDDRDSNIKLLIVGDGDLYAYLLKLSTESEKIITTGRVDFKNIPDLISVADICVLPSEYNDIMRFIVPIKLYEYMAAGKPVIASKLPGIVREFGILNGVLYCNDNDDLISRAKSIFTNSQGLTIGEKGRRYMASCDWSTITLRYNQIIQTLIKENSIRLGKNGMN